jgi:hypothetical protein
MNVAVFRRERAGAEMSTLAHEIDHADEYPIRVDVEPALRNRNRLTTAFRIFLAIPHLILVGGPLAAVLSLGWRSGDGWTFDWGASGGVFGVVAAVCAVIAWFAIVFTGKHPQGLWSLTTFYLRWRVRAVTYTAMLRDEYPPFGESPYPATLELPAPTNRDRVSVAFRMFLAIPHLLAVWLLSVAWGVTRVL